MQYCTVSHVASFIRNTKNISAMGFKTHWRQFFYIKKMNEENHHINILVCIHLSIKLVARRFYLTHSNKVLLHNDDSSDSGGPSINHVTHLGVMGDMLKDDVTP